MSQYPTEITEDIYKYILEISSAEDDFLKELKLESAKAGIPEISISADQARFMQFLIRTINAKYILEIGTLAGYSAISMARALPDDGKLITVEYEELHYKFALEKVKQAGLNDKIEVIHSSGLEFLKNYDGRYIFDFVFVDADKPNYFKYLNLSHPYLRKGGIFAADNAFAFGYVTDSAPERDVREVKSIKSFNKEFVNNKDYFSSIVPIADGLILGLKIK